MLDSLVVRCRRNSLSIVFASLAMVLPAGTYLSTMARGLVWGDGVELAAVCESLGIAHPTGYPLFTLLGYLFTRIVVGGSPAFEVTLFCALVMAVACGLMYHLLLTMSRRLARRVGVDPRASALAGTLAFAWAAAPWAHGTRIEVYGLQLLLQLAIVIVAFRVLESPAQKGRDVLACLWSLGLGHHLLALASLPLVVAAALVRAPGEPRSVRSLLRFLVYGTLGFLPNLYLPLRALSSPGLNFGDPSTLERWFWTMTGGSYLDRFLAADGEGVPWSLAGFLEHLARRGEDLAFYVADQIVPGSSSLGIWPVAALVGFGLVGVGARACWKMRPVFTLAWLAMGFGYLVVLMIYNIEDVSDYQLGFLGWMWPLIWHGLLSISLLHWGSRPDLLRLYGALFCLPILFLVANWQRSDRSADQIPDLYAERLFQGLPEGAYLVTEGDVPTATAWYLQAAEMRRMDIQVICLSLLHHDWYIQELQARGVWGREAQLPSVGPATDSIDRLISEVLAYLPRDSTAFFVVTQRSSAALEKRLNLLEVRQLLDELEVVEILARGQALPPYRVLRDEGLGQKEGPGPLAQQPKVIVEKHSELLSRGGRLHTTDRWGRRGQGSQKIETVAVPLVS